MKKTLLLLILPVLSFGQCVGDCDNGQGKYTWEKSDDWCDGEWLNGTFVKGKYYWKESGDWFDGEWKDGTFVRGKYYWKESGDWFDGEWKNGTFVKGKYYWKESGDWFDGEWKDGNSLNGTRLQNDPSGDRCYITLANGRKIKRSCDSENKYNSDDISGPKSMRINLTNKEAQSDNAFFVNLVINNQEIRFLFDTGATDFLVNLSQWKKMKKAGLKSEYLNITGKAEVVGGVQTSKYYKILDPIQIGDFKIKNIIIAVCQSCKSDKTEADNLIGVGFFKKFSNVEWSMNKNTLTLYK